MKKNPLLKIKEFGQSVWMDYIQRGMLLKGELKKLVDEDGLSGVTSNPAIFGKAIAESSDYDTAIRALALQGKSVEEMYQALTVEDIQLAADQFLKVYDQSEGRDGFVSLEVSPRLAHDSAATIEEARRLRAAAGRPNVLIKVPGTREGLTAIRQLISDGLSINVTLLFGLSRYREVADAYISGLEIRAAQRMPLKQIVSVASFFLSRIDVLVDPLLDKLMKTEGGKAALAQQLHGRTAIASAKTAYQIYHEIFSDERFRKLAAEGARTQRVLWASTGTKNPAYSDVKYVEPLIGPDTINTMPLETIHAYRDHGDPAPRLSGEMPEAARTLAQLAELGIDIDEVTQQLEDEGVDKFIKPYDKLLNALREKRSAAVAASAGSRGV
jgi:transaldolase